LIDQELQEFKKNMKVLDYEDMEQIQRNRKSIIQIELDISCLLSSIFVFKKKIAEFVNKSEKYSLLPTKRALLDELDRMYECYRGVLFPLKETSQFLRDSYVRIVEQDREE
jgi:hypothetical protein